MFYQHNFQTNLVLFRYNYVKTRNIFQPSTKIGQEAELRSQQIFLRNAGRQINPQTAEGRKLYQEFSQLNTQLAPQFFSNANILRQLKNESTFIDTSPSLRKIA